MWPGHSPMRAQLALRKQKNRQCPERGRNRAIVSVVGFSRQGPSLATARNRCSESWPYERIEAETSRPEQHERRRKPSEGHVDLITSSYAQRGSVVATPFLKVTVIIAITMSPKRASAAKRVSGPTAIAIPPKNSMDPPKTAKNNPGRRWAMFA